MAETENLSRKLIKPQAFAYRTALSVFGKTYNPGKRIPDKIMEKLGPEEAERLTDSLAIRIIEVDENEDFSELPTNKLHQPGKFNLNPDHLGDLALDRLQAMCVERGVAPPTSKKRAIAALTKDYREDLDGKSAVLDEIDSDKAGV